MADGDGRFMLNGVRVDLPVIGMLFGGYRFVFDNPGRIGRSLLAFLLRLRNLLLGRSIDAHKVVLVF